MSVFRTVGLILLVAILLGGAWLLMSVQSGGRRARNVILISIDTCRADHLSCYGHSRQTTPNIDAVAAEGILFENVISPLPNTLPAHCSMLTGTIPPYHGVHFNMDRRLPDSSVTLAEALRAHGYATAAVVSAFVLDSQFGLDQGFDTYIDEFEQIPYELAASNERKADDTTRLAVDWIEKNKDKPFFLFVHYFDPHYPFEPPEPFATRFAPDYYSGEVSFVDHCIGELIANLKRLELYDSALLIITADHGEGLGDRGEHGHGFFVYHSTTKVPLVIKPPAYRTSMRVTDIASLIDITPTILAYAGVEQVPDIQGEDLSRRFTEKKRHSGDRYVYSESLLPTQFGCNSLLAMETNEWKYIQTTRPELYHLVEDAGETKNVIERHPREAGVLQGHLKAVLEENARPHNGNSAAALDSESRARLEALGYVGGKLDESFEFDTGREDPKDFIRFYEAITQANHLYFRKKYVEAAEVCEQMLVRRPDLTKAHELLAKIAARTGDLKEAVERYQVVLELDAASAEAHNELGKVLVKLGRTGEAIPHFQEAVRLASGGHKDKGKPARMMVNPANSNPLVFRARLNLADALFERAAFVEAAEQYRQALKQPPFTAERSRLNAIVARAYYRLGAVLSMQRNRKEAIEAYQEALKHKPDFTRARRALDAALAAQTSSTPP